MLYAYELYSRSEGSAGVLVDSNEDTRDFGHAGIFFPSEDMNVNIAKRLC